MVFFSGLILSLVFIHLAIGSLTDIKWRIVPDWLSYSAIAAGFALRSIESIILKNPQPFYEGVLGFAVFFALGCAAFYLKLWGGGDSKVLMGLGALLGLWIDPSHLMLGITSNFIIVGGIYGLIWFIAIGITHFSRVMHVTRGLLSVRSLAYLQSGVIVLSLLITIYGYILDAILSFSILSVGVLLIFYTFVIARAIEQCCFIKQVYINKVEEGDWIIDPIIINKKRFAGPEDTGISLSQIAAIKKADKKNSVLMKVKEGIPFIPNFLLTFIVTLLFGNIMFKIMGIV